MKLLICGTRKKGYAAMVRATLDGWVKSGDFNYGDVIIEGCCPDSADAYAEEWATEHSVELKHFPSTPGNYLQRNWEMVKECDEVLALWDGYSYGTCMAIAAAVSIGKKVRVVMLR